MLLNHLIQNRSKAGSRYTARKNRLNYGVSSWHATILLSSSLSRFQFIQQKSFRVGLDNYDAVMKTFLAAKRDLGEILSSCEMIDQFALECSVDNYNLT